MPVAAAAMCEVFGDGEYAIVKSILAQVTAGDTHRSKEVACETVGNLLMTNKLLYALRPADAIWQTLARNVFPDAPKPDNESPWAQKCPMPTPSNDMDYFYMMGARHRRVRLARELLDDLVDKQTVYSVAHSCARQKLIRWWGENNRVLRHKLTSDERRDLKKLWRTKDRMDWIRNRLDEAVQYCEDAEVHVAEANLKEWHGGPRLPPRVRRQNAMRDLRDATLPSPSGRSQYPESSDDEAGDG